MTMDDQQDKMEKQHDDKTEHEVDNNEKTVTTETPSTEDTALLKIPFIQGNAKLQNIIRWVIMGGTVLSTIGIIISVVGCKFMRIGLKETKDEDLIGHGFFRRAVTEDNNDFLGCLAYSEEYEDESFDDAAVKAGRAFAVLALILILVALIMRSLLMCFVQFQKVILWRAGSGLLVAAWLCNLLSFSIMAADVCAKDQTFDSFSAFDDDGNTITIETTCKLGSSGSIAIVNVFVLMALTIASVTVGPPPNPVFRLWNAEGTTSGNVIQVNVDKNMTITDDGVEVQQHSASGRDNFYDNAVPSPVPVDDRSQTNIETRFTDEGKVTVTTVTHRDGSKTITQSVEAVDDSESDE